MTTNYKIIITNSIVCKLIKHNITRFVEFSIYYTVSNVLITIYNYYFSNFE